jgi:hypothetical protein
MPQRLTDTLDNWPAGVITAIEGDQLPPGAAPRGRNSAFVSIGPERAKVGFRKGATPAIDAPLTSEPEVYGGFYFRRSNATQHHLIVGKDGSLWKRNTNGTRTLVSATALTADKQRPGFAVANDYLFILNGTDAKKFDGTALTAFGITAPSGAPSHVVASAGAMLGGTYEFFLTYWNNNASTESARGVTTVPITVADNEKVTLSWGAPSDAQVTHVMIYGRRQESGPNFYRIIAGTTPAAAACGGFPVATLSVEVNFTQNQYSAFRTLAPAVNDNYPPPAGAMHPVWHKSRMFVHDKNNVYYSEIEDAENFNTTDRYEPIDPEDGDEIVTIHSTNNVLVVLKRFRSYIIVGDDPASWSVDELSPTIGTDSPESVVSDPNGVTYWWDHTVGPAAWRGLGTKPEGIGVPLIGPSLDPTVLNQSRFDLVVAGVDSHPLRQRVLFAVPEYGKTRNNRIIPFNYQLKGWEAEFWNPFDVASMWTANDANGQQWLWMGNYSGRVYQWWVGNNDGVPAGELTKGNVVSSTSTTLTCSKSDGTTPGWTVDGLKDLAVYGITQAGDDIQRRRILSNTADTLTIETSWGLNPNSTFTFAVGACDFQWDTPWYDGGYPFNKKRYEFFFIGASSPDSGVLVTVDLMFTYDLLNVIKDRSFTMTGDVLYDAAVYDEDRYASTVLEHRRFRVGTTGKAWRARVRSLQPDVSLTLLKLQMQGVLLSTKS